MNIGIMTCWKPDDNYGTQIQCFALQTYLRKKGHNAFLIRYLRSNDLVKIPLSQRKLKNIINPVKIIRILYVHLLAFKLKKSGNDHNRNAPEFRDKYLNQTKEYPDIYALENDPPRADVYIVGSDQVWNINYRQINNIRAHYLDFGDANTKRISYAASFGFGVDHLTREYIDTVYPLLRKFDGISVRESSGCEICNRIGINHAVQVCDPTMLLKPEDYLDCFRDEKIITPEKEYVFVYNLSATSEINIYDIEKWSKENNLEVIYVTGHGKSDSFEKCYPSIPEWVYFIAKAKYVITNSFHGSVFALLFHKKLAIYPVTGTAFGNPNSRLNVLIDLIGENIIASEENPFVSIFEKKFDWASFENRKENLVAVGKGFLSHFIDG